MCSFISIYDTHNIMLTIIINMNIYLKIFIFKYCTRNKINIIKYIRIFAEIINLKLFIHLFV